MPGKRGGNNMAQPIGNMIVKVGLDDTGFNRGIEGLKRQMRLANSEMKAAGQLYKSTGEQSKLLKSKMDGLNNQYKIQGKLVEEHRKRYEKLLKEKGKDNRETQIQAKRLNDAIHAHAKLGGQLKDVAREYNNTIKKTGKASELFSVFKKDSDKLSKSLNNVYKASKNVGKTLVGLGAAGAAGIAGVTHAAADFEQSMSKVKALSGATGEAFEGLKETARHLGATTQYTDGEVAEGMEMLARSGLKANEIVQAMPGMLNTAAASQTDLALASDIVTDVLSEFNLKASETGRVADVLTYGVNNSNSTMEDFGYAMKYAGPIASTAGYSMESLGASIALMSMHGIKASQAGTSLRQIITRLAAPPKPAANALYELGIKTEDAAGKMKPLSTIIGEVIEKTKGYTDAEKIRIEKQLAGQTALSGFAALMHEGRDEIDKFTDAMKGSAGTAETTAVVQMDNLKGSFNYLRAAINNAAISLGNNFVPIIRPIVDQATKVVTAFDKLPPSVMTTIATVLAAGTAFSLLGGGFLLTLGLLPRMAEGWKVLRSASGFLTRNVNASSSSLSLYSTRVRAAGAASVVASTEMSRVGTSTVAATTRMERLSTSSGKGAKALKGLGGASRVAGLGMSFFGGPLGMIGNLALMFLPEIVKFGGKLFSVGANAVKSAGGIGKLAKSGFGLFNIFKKGLGVIGLLRGGLSLLGGPVGLAVTAVTTLASAGYKYYENLKSRVIPETIDFGDKVSESTAKAVNAYEKLNTNVAAKLDYYYLTHTKITSKIKNEMTSKYDEMAKTLKDGYQKSTDNALDVLGKFYSQSKDISKKEADGALKKIQDGNAKKQKEIDDSAKKIKAIYETASKEHRDITVKEKQEIEKLTKDMNKNVETALSKSAEEQKVIAGKLKDRKGELSAKEAAATVKKSKEAKDKVVKNADKQRDDVIAAAEKEYYGKGTMTKKQYRDTVNAANKQHDKTVKKAEDTHDGVVDAAKKQAKGHTDQVDWETGEVLGMWDTFKIDLAHAVNAVTGGINKVLKFFHIPEIPEWKPPGYAKGTNNHPGGVALVGEEGYELAHSPGIGTYMVGVGGPHLIDLPAGSSVLPHKQSKEMIVGEQTPGYAGGVGKFFKKAYSNVSGFVSKGIDKGKEIAGVAVDKAKNVGKMASDAMEWVSKGPKKMVQNLIKSLGILPMGNGKGMFSIAGGVIKHVGDGAVKWLKDKLDIFGGAFKGKGGSKDVKKWVLEALSIKGLGTEFASALETIAMMESGGNPNVVNTWDSNWKAGHPSQGLMQFVPSTFNAHKEPGFDNIKNPVHQILASINYLNSRYGGIMNHPGLKSMAKGGKYVGYAKGGVINNPQVAALGENGYREYAITTEPAYRGRSLQLFSMLGKELGVNTNGMVSQPLQLLSLLDKKTNTKEKVEVKVIQENNHDSHKEMIAELKESNVMLRKTVSFLAQIAAKSFTIDSSSLDQHEAGRYLRQAYDMGIR